MSSDLVCPSCRDDSHLTGDRVDGTIRITCSACELSWDRDLTPRCPTCGRDDVVAAAQSVWEKSRGSQLSITSLEIIHLCPTCDPELLRVWWDSGTPLPARENPAEGMR